MVERVVERLLASRSRAQKSRLRSASQIANANIPDSRSRHVGPHARYASSSTSVSDRVRKDDTGPLELGPQSAEVVDLAVEHDREPPSPERIGWFASGLGSMIDSRR